MSHPIQPQLPSALDPSDPPPLSNQQCPYSPPSENHPISCQEPIQKLFAQITALAQGQTKTSLPPNLKTELDIVNFLLEDIVDIKTSDRRMIPLSKGLKRNR